MTRTGLKLVTLCLVLSGAVSAAESRDQFWKDMTPEVHGYYEARAGYRLQNDPYEKDMSIMEARTQIDLQSLPQWGTITVKGDGYVDGVTERGEFDLSLIHI